MTGRLFDQALTAGQVVRVTGLRGKFRAVEPCDPSGRAWWFLPCGERSGWRAFRADRCRPVKGVR